jgi:hypothetical protein
MVSCAVYVVASRSYQFTDIKGVALDSDSSAKKSQGAEWKQ